MTRTLVAACALAAALGACHTALPEGDGTPAAESPAPPPPDIAALERRLELAKGDTFYLLLDQDGTQLRLMFGGAVLQEYPVQSLSVGRPRTAFAATDTSADWRTNIWDHGTLVPPRPTEEQLIRTVSTDDDADPEAAIPPTAEEAIAVPPRFRIRFDGGLAVEVQRAPDAEEPWWPSFRHAWAVRWQDVWSALRSSDRDVVRVRVMLARDAADSLYRALPPDTKLIIGEPVPTR